MENVKLDNNRETWGSRFGFIMSTAGFSVGLGNIWRFPYLTSKNGGGAFVIMYLAICFLICIPLFIAEIGLGRKSRLNPIAGMQKLTKKGSPWAFIGWFGSLASFVLMTYYMMVIGWMVAYFIKMITGFFNGMSAAEIEVAYNSFIANPVQMALFTAIVVVVLGVVVSKGIKNGVEKACKVMMPALLVMLVVLAIRSFTLPGAAEGLKWYLTPDFSKVNGKVALDALGQAFFSIGIGTACAFIYGSYLDPQKSDLASDSKIVIIIDTAVAVTAGLVIFPTLFSFGADPSVSGPGLLFKVMPKLFAELPGGNFFGGMFFLLVMLAGFTSGIGYLEAVVTTFSEQAKVDRKKAVWIVLGAIYVLGIPSMMSHGPLANVSILGRNIFDFTDYLSGNVLMALSALLVSLYTAFVWKFENYRNECNIGSPKLGVKSWWKPIVVYLTPIALIWIMITGIF